MVLHGEDGQLAMSHAFDGAVVEIQMGDLEFRWQALGFDRKTMILRGNFNFLRGEV